VRSSSEEAPRRGRLPRRRRPGFGYCGGRGWVRVLWGVGAPASATALPPRRSCLSSLAAGKSAARALAPASPMAFRRKSSACSAGSEGRAAASAAAPPFPMALSKQLTLIRRGMLPERRAAARAAASAQPQPSRAYVCSYEPHLPHRDRPRFPEIRRAARVMSAPRPPPAARHTRCGRRRRKEALDLVARARGLLAGAEGGGEEPESGQTWATRRREPRRRSGGAEVAPRPGSRRTSPRRTSPLASLSLWRKEAWLRQVGASSGRACPP